MEPRLQSLLINTLYTIIPAVFLLWVLASSIGQILELAPNYSDQCLLVFVGLLLALSPFLPQHLPQERFGAANRVTLLRAGIAALAAGSIGHSELTPAQAWCIAALTGLALLLDGVDGWLARRHNLESRFGARFDMEVDAFLILVMAALVYQADKAGGWILLSGVMRYAFIALAQCLPWLNQSLPPRKRRQTVCVIQTIVLAVCLTPPLARPWSALLAAVALGLLALSFTVDIVWLARHPTLKENY
ncbi:MAG: CDP-alcohol phosphatidyltransferase family protein [Candidatus Competibacteraceae bacterium]|nr:CDP-alcohol phosphatidyltransferase family protein [Candidatus Competibacteraceae bacterium]